MSESLAPDPKPSCCLSSPQGTCEQHMVFSEAELRVMELEKRIENALWTVRTGCQLNAGTISPARAQDVLRILEGRE